MIDAFISYSSRESEAAVRLCALLEDSGVPCWMAPRNLTTGSHWAGSIAQALRNARLVVLLFSRNSNESLQVLREVALAADNRLPILPVRIDGTRPSDEMAYFLSICHWLDVPDGAVDKAITPLLAAIRPVQETPVPKPQAADPMGGMLVDIYDEEMSLMGTAVRAEAHEKGLWHKTFHCWFVSRADGVPSVWFQRRSMSKADFPGLYDITASRHLNAGESDREGIGRIVTELGVTVRFEDVIYLGVRQYAEKKGAFHNCEFNSVYLFETPYALTDYDLQPAEVSGIIRLSAGDGLKLFSGRVSEVSAIACLYEDGKRCVSGLTVTADDFVPRVDDYYRRIFQTAIDYYDGQSPLTI